MAQTDVLNAVPKPVERTRQNNPYVRYTTCIIGDNPFSPPRTYEGGSPDQWQDVEAVPDDVELAELFIGRLWWRADPALVISLLAFAVDRPIYKIRQQPVKKAHPRQNKVSGAWRVLVHPEHLGTWLQYHGRVVVRKEGYPESTAKGFKAPVHCLFVAAADPGTGRAPSGLECAHAQHMEVLAPITIEKAKNVKTPPYQACQDRWLVQDAARAKVSQQDNHDARSQDTLQVTSARLCVQFRDYSNDG
jgi:hypothetical protein